MLSGLSIDNESDLRDDDEEVGNGRLSSCTENRFFSCISMFIWFCKFKIIFTITEIITYQVVKR